MSELLISVAIAAYNVEEYIDATLRSIDRQSVDLSCIEFIIVDDGSQDRTLEIAEAWASDKENTHVITQQNQGVASARQQALEHASGIWFTSVDPDDLLDKNYFKNVVKFINNSVTDDVQLLVTNLISLNDSSGRLSNNHALRHRFDRGSRVSSLDEEPQNIQLGATAFMRLDSIQENAIAYDLTVRPTFEDGHFIGRYLASFSAPSVGIIADAKYYYRKRKNSNSLVQSSWSNRDKYSTVLLRGYLDLFLQVKDARRHVPRWAQFMVLYDLFWYFIEDYKQFSRSSWLDENSKNIFIEHLIEVFRYIEIETILEFNIYEIPLHIRHSVIIKFKNVSSTVIESPSDSQTYSVVSVFSDEESFQTFRYFGSNIVSHYFYGELFSREIIQESIKNSALLKIATDNHALNSPNQVSYKTGIPYFQVERKSLSSKSKSSTSLLNVPLKFSRVTELMGIRRLTTGHTYPVVYAQALNTALLKIWNRTKAARERKHRVEIIKKSKLTIIQDVYKNAWCIMDRPGKAGDNGEHLYRYLQAQRPDINIFFILERNSSDWSRLERDGFKLLEPQSDDLALAVLNSDFIVSSDAVVECMYPVHRALVKRAHSQFVFLQHGVIMNDLSRWLNPKAISLMITSTAQEYQALTGPNSPYSIAPDNVVLAGLARFDALYKQQTEGNQIGQNTLLIMPTWRHGLTTLLASAESSEEQERIFANSDFAVNWLRLISDSRFRNATIGQRIQPIFVPHPSLVPYKHLLNFPDFITISDPGSSSLQKYISSSKLVLTDYSSISFDAAYIGVPTIYYQFDRDEIFGGSHNFRPGYFTYQKHGFGPVYQSIDEVVNALSAELMEPSLRVTYGNRFRQAFPHPDDQNCVRIVDAIEASHGVIG